MKITDVTLTLFAWDDIPPTHLRRAQPLLGLERAGAAAHRHRRRRRGPCLPGLGLQSRDDRRAGADHPPQAGADGQGSAASRGASTRRSVKRQRACGRARHRRGRRGAVGSRRQGDGPADPSAARHLSRIGAGLCQFRRAASPDGVRRGGDALQGIWLGRLQDPSADALAGRHQGLRGGAPRRRRLHDHARFDLELRLSGGDPRRPRRRGDGLLLVRGSAGRPGHLQLRQAEAAALDPDHGHRVSAAPASIPTSPGSCCRRPTICAATWR